MSELTVESPPVAQVSGNRVCAGCQEIRTQLRNRLPRGWKRLGDQTFCETCWQRRYLLRSIAVPIASPLDQDWQSFRRTLREMWQLTTQASNWMVTELYSHDVRRSPDVEKMPPMERRYLYPKARIRFPALPSQSIAALEQAVQRKYRALRFQTIWTFERSLPTFRYPVPFVIRNQGWSATVEEEKPVVSLDASPCSAAKRYHRTASL